MKVSNGDRVSSHISLYLLPKALNSVSSPSIIVIIDRFLDPDTCRSFNVGDRSTMYIIRSLRKWNMYIE